jgi:hypothetical protein
MPHIVTQAEASVTSAEPFPPIPACPRWHPGLRITTDTIGSSWRCQDPAFLIGLNQHVATMHQGDEGTAAEATEGDGNSDSLQRRNRRHQDAQLFKHLAFA